MVKKLSLLVALAGVVVFMNAGLAFSQDMAAEKVAPGGIEINTDTQWVWGEVVSVDVAKSQLVVKYLDYETDMEKEMTLAADEKTTYENVQALADIQPKDTVSVDYAVGSDGKSVAKNISVEKPDGQEMLQGEGAPAMEGESAGVAPEAPAEDMPAQ
jgi:biopolymer transport protein ExbD